LAHFLAFLFLRAKPRRRKEIYAQTALVSWLSFLSSFRSQSREDAKKSMRKRLLFLGSQLLALVSFFFSLAKTQSRKEIYAQTALASRLLALGSCLLLLDTSYLILIFVLGTWYN
jgi:hypothetical protein